MSLDFIFGKTKRVIAETLAKRARAELTFTKHESRNYAFLKLHFNPNFYIFNIYINLKKIMGGLLYSMNSNVNLI